MKIITITHYRVEVWSASLYRWIPAMVEAPNLPELFAAVEANIDREADRDPLGDPRNRRIVEVRETVIPWPEGASVERVD